MTRGQLVACRVNLDPGKPGILPMFVSLGKVGLFLKIRIFFT